MSGCVWSYSLVKSGKGHGVGTCIGNTQVATGKPSNKPPIWGSFIAPSCGDFGDGLWHWVYHITQDLSDDEVFLQRERPPPAPSFSLWPKGEFDPAQVSSAKAWHGLMP